MGVLGFGSLYLEEVQELGKLFIRLADQVGRLQPRRRPLVLHGCLPFSWAARSARSGLPLPLPGLTPAAASHWLDRHIHPDLVPQPCSRQRLDSFCLCR